MFILAIYFLFRKLTKIVTGEKESRITLLKEVKALKMKRLTLVACFLAISAVLVSTASACTTSRYSSYSCCSTINCCYWPKLPDSPVIINIASPTLPYSISLSDVPAGYTITNKAYNGYCVDVLGIIYHGTDYSAIITSSLDQGRTWNRINYILNHKQGTAEDVQAAIWLVMGYTEAQILEFGHIVVTATAKAMFNKAMWYGSCFDPSTGQIVALIVTVEGFQTTIIEVIKVCCYTSCCYYSGCYGGCSYSGYYRGCSYGGSYGGYFGGGCYGGYR